MSEVQIISGEKPITPNEAINYHTMGIEQLDQVLYGEKHAKEAALTSLISGTNLIYTGLPGGGKTTLARSIYLLVEDIDRNEVAVVPALPDLKAAQLVGGKVEHEKVAIDEQGHQKTETVTTVIDGLIKPSTKYIRIDEMNRVNPLALQALLPVLETGELETTAGIQTVDKLNLIVATMNPSESRQSTFTISDAMASRFTAGAMLGEKGTVEERIELDKSVRAFKGNQEAISPVVTAAGLIALKNYVETTAVDSATDHKISQITIRANEVLEQYKIHETDRRIGLQIAENARTLNSIRDRDHTVREEDLVDAVRMVLVARLGALKRINGTDIDSKVNQIVNG